MSGIGEVTKLKVQSMALLKDGRVSIVGTIVTPSGMFDTIHLLIDKESWEKIRRNVTHWHSS